MMMPGGAAATLRLHPSARHSNLKADGQHAFRVGGRVAVAAQAQSESASTARPPAWAGATHTGDRAVTAAIGGQRADQLEGAGQTGPLRLAFTGGGHARRGVGVGGVPDRPSRRWQRGRGGQRAGQGVGPIRVALSEAVQTAAVTARELTSMVN